jgi:hypothetical protein
MSRIKGNRRFDGSVTATTYYGDGSKLTGINADNYYVTGGTLSGSNLILNRTDALSAVTIDMSNLVGNEVVYFRGVSNDTGDYNSLVSGTTIPWDGPNVKSNGITHSTGSTPTRIYVDEAGTYDMYSSLYWESPLTQRSQIKLNVWINGVEDTTVGTGQGGYARDNSGAEKTMSHISTTLNLNANDYIEIKGTGESVAGDTSMLAGRSVFKIHKLQGVKGDIGPAGNITGGTTIYADIYTGNTTEATYYGDGSNLTGISNIGLIWQDTVEFINLIGNSSTPIAGVNNDGYIIDTGGDTGAWSGFTAGDLIQYQTDTWVLIKSLAVNDRFVCAFDSPTPAIGDFVGNENAYVEITGGTAGNWAYSFVTPEDNWATYVTNENAFFSNVAITYSETLAQWVQISGIQHEAGDGLVLIGNTFSVDFDTDPTLSADSDIVVASQKAIKSYVDGAAGESNTLSSVGGGNDLYYGKSGVDLQIRTLVAGTNVTITSGATTLTINSSGGGGGGGGSSRITGFTQTTNATPAEIDKIDTLTDDATNVVEVYIKAWESGAAEYGVWKRTLTVTSVSGTVVIREENADVDKTSSGLNANSVSFTVNGSDIDIDVTGIAATTIDWASAYEIIL